MVDILTTRQQQRSGRIEKRSLSTTTMILKMMMMLLLMTVLVLSTPTTTTRASTLAESETNDLNSLESTTAKENNITAAKQTKPETRQYPYLGFMTPPLSVAPSSLAGCPLCDSSVYSYCSHKVIHDSCCCDFPGSAIYQKPPQCVYFDCSLLYAKSCNEHGLIKNCCCNNPY